MSRYSSCNIVCSICGRYCYSIHPETSDNVILSNFYTLYTKEGEEHLCANCYAAGLSNQFELKSKDQLRTERHLW